MKLILRIYMILCTAVFSLYVLFLIAGLTARQLVEMPLQNGVVLARKHIFADDNRIYLWKENGDLIIDEPVYWMNMGSNYVWANLVDGRDILYDTKKDELIFSTSEDYSERSNALRNNKSDSDKCQWGITGGIGPSVILFDSRYVDRIIARQCGDAQDTRAESETGAGAQ